MARRLIIIFLVMSLLMQADLCWAQSLIPNDPDYSKQWYLDKLNMPQVWNRQTGSNDVIVAVIDSGVDISHPDLHDNIWVNQKEIGGDGIDNDHNGYIDDVNGWDFIASSDDPRPKYDPDCIAAETCLPEAIDHGTLIAGIIAAIGNNGQGIAGLAWKTKIMPLRVLDQNGNGSTTDVAKAIDYAVNNGANIINLSFVSQYYDQVLADAIQRAYDKGVLVISAAGNAENVLVYNDGTSSYTPVAEPVNLDTEKRYPACLKNSQNQKLVLGVASSDQNNQLSNFSNYGSSCVDIVAPGQDIFGALVYDPNYAELGGRYGGYLAGTSLAAPIVSGIAALIKANNPDYTSAQIRAAILNNADNIDSLNASLAGKLGNGELDPLKIFQNLSVNSGSLIKGSLTAVYYLAADNKRYVFPDSQTFFSWYGNFKNVKTISDSELASYALGGIVTLHPGSLVKITSDPRVYAVTKGGVLHWLSTPDLIASLYGLNWQIQVKDISDSFFINYRSGDPIGPDSGYNLTAVQLSVNSINDDLTP